MDQSNQAGADGERADEERGRRRRAVGRAGALEELHGDLQQVDASSQLDLTLNSVYQT